MKFNNKELQMVVALVVWALVLLAARFSNAETVYNFYFNPEQTDPKAQIAQQSTSEKNIANTFCLRNYVDFGFDIKCKEKPWMVSLGGTGFMGNGRNRFKLGNYNLKFGNEELKKIEGQQIGLGSTLALKYYPSSYLGIYGNGIYYYQESAEIITFAVGFEVIPLLISIFGIEDLLEIGSEIGWSNFEDYNKDYNFRSSQLFPNRQEMKWYGGGLARLNVFKNFAFDLSVRKSFSQAVWMANAGIGIRF